MKTRMRATVVVPMIGDPIAQAATPGLWNARFREKGIDAVCVPVDLPPEGLDAFVGWVRAARNVPGFVTTVPHKAALPAYCDVLAPEVELLGTANTVVKRPDGRLEAAMFDGEGMTEAMIASGAQLVGVPMAICGAGAAGSAIAVAALTYGVARVTITDRDPGRAAALVERLSVSFPDRVAAGPGESGALLVNASPAGSLGEDALPFAPELIESAVFVAEAVTDPAETEFLARARAAGVPRAGGQQMAAHQAAAMRRFLGLE